MRKFYFLSLMVLSIVIVSYVNSMQILKFSKKKNLEAIQNDSSKPGQFATVSLEYWKSQECAVRCINVLSDYHFNDDKLCDNSKVLDNDEGE